MAYTGQRGDEIARCEDIPNAFRKYVRVPSSDYVAEIVGRNGDKIKELREATSTKILTPKRGEDPIFTIVGRKLNVLLAKRLIEYAVSHFTHVRNGLPTLTTLTHAPAAALIWAPTPSSTLAPTATSTVAPMATMLPPTSATNASHAMQKFFFGDIKYDHVVHEEDIGLVVGAKGTTVKSIQKITLTTIISPQRIINIPVFTIVGNAINVKFASLLIDAVIKTRQSTNESNTVLSVEQIFEEVIAYHKQNTFVEFAYFFFHIISSSNVTDYSLLPHIHNYIVTIFEGNHVNPIQPIQLPIDGFNALSIDEKQNGAIKRNLRLDLCDSNSNCFNWNNVSSYNDCNGCNYYDNNSTSHIWNNNHQTMINGNSINYNSNKLILHNGCNLNGHSSDSYFANGIDGYCHSLNGHNLNGDIPKNSHSNFNGHNAYDYSMQQAIVSQQSSTSNEHHLAPFYTNTRQPSNMEKPKNHAYAGGMFGFDPCVQLTTPNVNAMKNKSVESGNILQTLLDFHTNNLFAANDYCAKCNLKGRQMCNEAGICWECYFNRV